MRKTALFLILTLLLASFVQIGVFANNDSSIILNGEKIELVMPHTFKAGRTMVTIDSGFFEMLGATVRYDESEGKVWIEGEYSTVEFTLNKSEAYIHRKYDFSGIPLEVEMDVEPFSEDGKVYVPLRFAAEGLDAVVDWDGVNRSVLVTTAADGGIIPVERPVEYKEMDLHDIPDELAEWVEANRNTGGIWFKTIENTTYVLICSGEKPTGGYSIQLESITMVAPGSVYLTARVNSPDPDMMVTQALTYPCMLIVIENEEIQLVDGIIDDGLGDLPGVDKEDAMAGKTISEAGAAILPEDITAITLYSLDGEKVKEYKEEEFSSIAEAFNNATIDDSFYIMMITGNRLVISLKDGTVIEMTSYGSETNIVASMTGPEDQADGWHLVCPEIAGILLGKE